MGASCTRDVSCETAVEVCATSESLASRPTLCGSSADEDPFFQAGGSSGSAARKVEIYDCNFAIRRQPHDADWRRHYSLGKELGCGHTSTVFEAFPTGFGPAEDTMPRETMASSLRAPSVAKSCGAKFGCEDETEPPPKSQTPWRCLQRGRRVALKRFHTSGLWMFQQELRGLLAAGIHPHIVRLLDSFEDGGEDLDNALVLEYCDGGDLYDLYAANNGCSMVEGFVIQLIRQLLLALQHLVTRGLEHRDVKPENILLYRSPAETHIAVPQLKLADFGWAQFYDPDDEEFPMGGVGSLWYAPPELNPSQGGEDSPVLEIGPAGSCDMWSVGIITYLLLIGHSPFNAALYIRDERERAEKVMDLALRGKINTVTRAWPTLSCEARNFISSLVRPQPTQRLTIGQALQHPWISRYSSGYTDSMGAQLVYRPLSALSERDHMWGHLDGLQRAAWWAVARAASEPELIEIPVLREAASCDRTNGLQYLEELARELALASTPAWLSPDGVWQDVLRMAFRYLDVDGDGKLNADDFLQHLHGEALQEVVDVWIAKWSRGQSKGLLSRPPSALSFQHFCQLLSTQGVPALPGEAVASQGQLPGAAALSVLEEADNTVANKGNGSARATKDDPAATVGGGSSGHGPKAEVDDTLSERKDIFDKVCDRFLVEELRPPDGL